MRVSPSRRRCGPYLYDLSFAQELIARYDTRDPTRPLFLYGLSMENHQPYNPEKYGVSSGFPAQSDLLSQEDLAILDALVVGLHHADQALGILTDYFSQVERPVMLVFVGDHLPAVNLSDGVSLYTHLGISPSEEAADWDPTALIARLSTDYLIWTNYETQPAPDRLESCTFLGLHVLQQCGCQTWLRPPYIKQNMKCYRVVPTKAMGCRAGCAPRRCRGPAWSGPLGGRCNSHGRSRPRRGCPGAEASGRPPLGPAR